MVESEGPDASVGDVCYIYPTKSSKPLQAEVVASGTTRCC
ncbi:flagellum-specific ATP synthase [Paenibacillus sp. P1XP2]|nr:flagellum-specific ATP synthase [Paenibacillus sp. P1XP2]